MFVLKLDQEFFSVTCSAWAVIFNDFLTSLLQQFNNIIALDNIRNFTVQA